MPVFQYPKPISLNSVLHGLRDPTSDSLPYHRPPSELILAFACFSVSSPTAPNFPPHSLPKLEEMVDWLAWLCNVPEGLGEDSSSESLSKGTSSAWGSPSAGPGPVSSPDPEIEMCRQG